MGLLRDSYSNLFFLTFSKAGFFQTNTPCPSDQSEANIEWEEKRK